MLELDDYLQMFNHEGECRENPKNKDIDYYIQKYIDSIGLHYSSDQYDVGVCSTYTKVIEDLKILKKLYEDK